MYGDSPKTISFPILAIVGKHADPEKQSNTIDLTTFKVHNNSTHCPDINHNKTPSKRTKSLKGGSNSRPFAY